MPLRGGYLDEFSKAWGNLSIRWGATARVSAPLIAWMSLQLAIPQQVGLHQSPPPLHQPGPVSRKMYLLAERFLSPPTQIPGSNAHDSPVTFLNEATRPGFLIVARHGGLCRVA
jgi:hypothetical protein